MNIPYFDNEFYPIVDYVNSLLMEVIELMLFLIFRFQSFILGTLNEY